MGFAEGQQREKTSTRKCGLSVSLEVSNENGLLLWDQVENLLISFDRMHKSNFNASEFRQINAMSDTVAQQKIIITW